MKSLRYRKDTIEKALAAGAKIDSDQAAALEAFDDILQTLPPIEYHLLPGDAIQIDNTRIAHSRTAFDNPDRFLWRVRTRQSGD